MKKYLIGGTFLASMLILSMAYAAKPELTRQTVQVVPSNGKATVTIPDHAVQVADGVYFLGTAMDNGQVVEGYAYVRYKENHAKVCGNGVCEPGENANKCPEDCGGGEEPDDPVASTCYGFLSRGAKWNNVEPYVVNTTNGYGINENAILSNLEADIAKWEDEAGQDIIGTGTPVSEDLSQNYGVLNGANEVYFAELDQPGAIAVTIIWGVFGGPPKNRQLVEWDQVYNTYYDWSLEDDGVPYKMDFENIATHELGHSVGMGDLYTTDCNQQTMYGYADFAETNKRDLEAGDIAGINVLY